MSLFSRYAREKFVYTSPKQDSRRFIEDINRYSAEFGADCVLPTSEAGILACSSHRKDLSCFPIVPREYDIEMTFRKANTLKLAEALGVPVPQTVHIASGTSPAIEFLSLKFPIVIKSDSSQVIRSSRTSTSRGTAYVYDQNGLEEECSARLRSGESVLLQEFIDGYGVGISGLFRDGQPVALIGHRRLRESTPTGGPSALAESIEVTPELHRLTTSLFRAIGFTGPAMAEFRIDRHTGRPYLMEINGRLWGTVMLAPAAGLDLPYLLWKMLHGSPIGPEETRFQAGVKGRYLIGDTKCLMLALKGRTENWPGAFPTRYGALKAYFSSFFDRHTTELILTQDDPMPFFARFLQHVG